MKYSMSFKHPSQSQNCETFVCLIPLKYSENRHVFGKVMASLMLFCTLVANYHKSNDNDKWQPRL